MRLLRKLYEGTDRTWIVVMEVPREEYKRLYSETAKTFPDLERDVYVPHITLLYLGRDVVGEERELREAFGRVLAVVGEPGIGVLRGRIFDRSGRSEGRWPIVVEVGSVYLQRLNALLLRAFNEYQVQAQFLEYVPHITMGYSVVEPTALQKKYIGKEFGEVDMSGWKISLMCGEVEVM